MIVARLSAPANKSKAVRMMFCLQSKDRSRREKRIIRKQEEGHKEESRNDTQGNGRVQEKRMNNNSHDCTTAKEKKMIELKEIN